MQRFVPSLLVLLLTALNSHFAATVDVFVGSGFTGNVDGVGTNTMFEGLSSILPWGDEFLVVDGPSKVRIISRNREVRTVSVDSGLTEVIAGDKSRGLYCARGNEIWRYDASFNASPVTQSYGYVDGNLAIAAFGRIGGLAIDGDALFIADAGNRRIRKLQNGTVITVAGSGNVGSEDGKGIFSSFDEPGKLAVDVLGRLFVIDRYNFRRIDADGTVTSVVRGGVDRYFGIFAGNRVFVSYPGLNELIGTSFVNVKLSGDLLLRADSLARFDEGQILAASSELHKVFLISLQEAPVPEESVGIAEYAGITISGEVGRTYRIEATPNLHDTNTWISTAVIVLPKSPYTWFDESSRSNPKRFYRAAKLP